MGHGYRPLPRVSFLVLIQATQTLTDTLHHYATIIWNMLSRLEPYSAADYAVRRHSSSHPPRQNKA